MSNEKIEHLLGFFVQKLLSEFRLLLKLKFGKIKSKKITIA